METSTISEKEKVLKPTVHRKTVFLDSQGPILEHYLGRGTVINSASYRDMLTDKLKPVFQC
jgi:hypothetical protein